MSDQVTQFNRRSLLKSAAAITAASTVPAWFLEGCAARESEAATGEKPRVALIGCGGMGRHDAKLASKFGTITVICDVDEQHLADTKAKDWPDAALETDFRKVMERKDVDVVVCATVDHWHVLVSIAAMRAGKDVYCEKPLTLTIDEGKHLIKVAKETGRILQTGSQQRSNDRFRLACELVRNGRIGKVQHVDVFLPMGLHDGPFSTSSVPSGFNWDMWQGQTPEVDYVKEKTHRTFRYWWEYSGGTMTDWGAHHNDIALWGLGLERSGPVSIKGEPTVKMVDGGYTAASEYKVEYTYANGVTHTCQSTRANSWAGQVVDKTAQPHGIKFIGTDGWIWVTRDDIKASKPEFLTTPLPSSAERLYVSNDHMGNFFDCVKSRKPTICEPEIGHRSVSVCHLGVIAIRLGRDLKWDPAAETFVGDAEAEKWLSREMRKPWGYDSV